MTTSTNVIEAGDQVEFIHSLETIKSEHGKPFVEGDIVTVVEVVGGLVVVKCDPDFTSNSNRITNPKGHAAISNYNFRLHKKKAEIESAEKASTIEVGDQVKLVNFSALIRNEDGGYFKEGDIVTIVEVIQRPRFNDSLFVFKCSPDYTSSSTYISNPKGHAAFTKSALRLHKKRAEIESAEKTSTIEAGDQVEMIRRGDSGLLNEHGKPFMIGDIVTVVEAVGGCVSFKSVPHFTSISSQILKPKGHVTFGLSYVRLHKKKARIEAEAAEKSMTTSEAAISESVNADPFKGIKVGDRVKVTGNTWDAVNEKGKLVQFGDVVTVVGLCDDHHVGPVILIKSSREGTCHDNMHCIPVVSVELHKMEQVASESNPETEESVTVEPTFKPGDQVEIISCEVNSWHGMGEEVRIGDIVTISTANSRWASFHCKNSPGSTQSVPSRQVKLHKTAKQVASEQNLKMAEQNLKMAEQNLKMAEQKPETEESVTVEPTIRVGDQVEVIKNTKNAYYNGNRRLEIGDVITVQNVLTDYLGFVNDNESMHHIEISKVKLHKTADQIAREKTDYFNGIKVGDQVRIVHNRRTLYKKNGDRFEEGDIITVVDLCNDASHRHANPIVLFEASSHCASHPHGGIRVVDVELHKTAEQAAEEKTRLVESTSTSDSLNGMKAGDQVRVLDNPHFACDDSGKRLKRGDIVTIADVCRCASHEHHYAVVLFRSVHSCVDHDKMNYLYGSNVEIHKTAERIAEENKPKTNSTREIKVGDRVKVLGDTFDAYYEAGRPVRFGDVVTVMGMGTYGSSPVILIKSNRNCNLAQKRQLIPVSSVELCNDSEQTESKAVGVSQETSSSATVLPATSEEPSKSDPFKGIKVGDQVKVIKNEWRSHDENNKPVKSGDVVVVAGLCDEKHHPCPVILINSHGGNYHPGMNSLPIADVELYKTAMQIAEEAKPEAREPYYRNVVLSQSSGKTVEDAIVKQTSAKSELIGPEPMTDEDKKPNPFNGIKLGDRVKVLRNPLNAYNEKGHRVQDGDVVTVVGLCDRHHHVVPVILIESFGYGSYCHRGCHTIPITDVELHKTAERVAEESKTEEHQPQTKKPRILSKLFARPLFERRSI